MAARALTSAGDHKVAQRARELVSILEARALKELDDEVPDEDGDDAED